MKRNIVIIDYGVGNVQSVKEALHTLGENVSVSRDKARLEKADALILPGVGAFGEAMRNLNEYGLREVLFDLVIERRKPILGICLGMQLFAEKSEENGIHAGLGWVPGEVIKIKGDSRLRVPHVGWNDIGIANKSPLFDRISGTPAFYFDHSYHFRCRDESYVAAWVEYGSAIVSAIKNENIFGVQFHPEKSQINGLRLLRGFINSIHQYA